MSAAPRSARAPLVDSRTRVFLRDVTHRDRRRLEAFVADTYRAEHGAEVAHFLPTLMGIARSDGDLVGVIGVREAREPGTLFLESYLGAPIEAALAERIERPVSRTTIAEIGNLASATPGGGRILVTAFSHYLDAVGLTWAAFTATRPLRNSFAKLGVELIDIAPASVECVAAPASWGRYYDSDPRVTAVRIRDVALLSRINRRFAGALGAVRRAAKHVGVHRRLRVAAA